MGFSAAKEVQMKKLFTTVILALCLTAFPAFGQDPVFGPFSALVINEDVVKDVHTGGNDIYVKVAEACRDREFSVKISEENMAGYRRWQDSQAVMKVRVYQSDVRGKQGYTYRINTSAPFVEFWMGEQLILHLKRIQ
jgi:hypothetical protein